MPSRWISPLFPPLPGAEGYIDNDGRSSMTRKLLMKIFTCHFLNLNEITLDGKNFVDPRLKTIVTDFHFTKAIQINAAMAKIFVYDIGFMQDLKSLKYATSDMAQYINVDAKASLQSAINENKIDIKKN